MLIVLVVFYSGLLLFFISGPSMDDVDDLRKVVFVVAFLAVVACGMLIFVGLPVFSIGSADEPPEEAGARAPVDEEVPPEESPATAGEGAGEKPKTKRTTPGKRKAPSKRKTPRRSTRERASTDEG